MYTIPILVSYICNFCYQDNFKKISIIDCSYFDIFSINYMNKKQINKIDLCNTFRGWFKVIGSIECGQSTFYI